MFKTLTPAEFAAVPDEYPVRIGQVVPSVFPVSRATLYRMIARGDLPKPQRLTPGTATLRAGDLRAAFTTAAA